MTNTSRALATIVLSLALVLAAGARATEIHVDAGSGDDARDGLTWASALRTIGRALVIAARFPDSDTIRVAEGTYPENVLLARSDIALLGGHPAGGGPADPSANPTIIDGRAVRPVVTVSGDDGAVVLSGVTVDGFTLRNGAPLVRGNIAGGAGVFVEEAAVLLSNNVIASNVVDVASGKGGGLYLFRSQAGPSVIRDNRLVTNVVRDGVGGGAWIADLSTTAGAEPIVFARNDLRENEALALTDVDPTDDTEHDGNGGGVFAWGGATVFEDNRFEQNVARATNGQDYNGQGGALFLLDGAPLLTGNVISQNVAQAAGGSYGGSGGGAYLLQLDPARAAGARLEDNDFDGNFAMGGTGSNQGWGAGLNVSLFADVGPILTGNVFRSNLATGGADADSRGGGAYAFLSPGSGATLRIEGGTVEDNAAVFGGGGLWLFSRSQPADLVVDGTSIRANAADFASGVMVLGNADVRNVSIKENLIHDPDGDNVSEIRDTCPGFANPVQADADGDGQGDACDADDDDDGVLDASDNCDLADNPLQQDTDADGSGDACDGDLDADTVPDGIDNCPSVANLDQNDATFNGVGDACEPAAFDPLETNASGIWISGDGSLVNAEVVENVGQGVQVVGQAADPANSIPEDHASPRITNVTITANEAVGFITYLASGTAWSDSIVTGNFWSDGFDTELFGAGVPSSPGMTCDGVYFGDGVASLPCTGTGNLDTSLGTGGGPIRFVAGPLSPYYLSQVAAGQPADSPAVNAGTRPTPGTLAGRTTRTDEQPDTGTVDMGFHPATAASLPDPLSGVLRLGRTATGPEVTMVGVPGGVSSARVYRGDLDILWREYSHRAPFSGQPGNPECSVPVVGSFTDSAALGDGRDWYYLAVALIGSAEGSFGARSDGVPRPRPEDSPGDLVTEACP